jgi:hypothetical protein|tara:strand:+ start:178 stop:330 length:153 start_codon:yes stop_codon:yes gene_type:complete
MKIKKITKSKLIKILSKQEEKQHVPTYISPEETSQEDWIKGYNKWKSKKS